jgi:hypothetical protein
MSSGLVPEPRAMRLAVDFLGIAALPRRHRMDDRALALEGLVVGARQLALQPLHAGQHAHQALHAAELHHLVELVAEIVQVELARLHAPGDRHALLGIDRLGRLLDERDDVAHAEDAVGDAGGVEFLQPVHLLRGAEQLDRLAGDRAHGERGAAAAVAVDTGQDNTSDIDAAGEGACDIDRVLAGQAVDHQQRLVRVRRLFDLGHLDHEGLVDMGAAGGVEHDHVVAAELAGLDGTAGDLHRRLAGDDGQGIDADLLAEDGELLHRGRAARIERGHQHLLLLLFEEALGELGGGGGLARALQADHHDRHRRNGLEVDGDAVRAERVDQRVVDDFHDHLAGGHRLDDLGADRAVADLVGEGADDLKRHVGLEQGAAHLAHRLLDVGLAQRAAALEAVEDAGQSCRQAFEHAGSNRVISGEPRKWSRSPGTATHFAPEGACCAVGREPPGSGPGGRRQVSDEREWGADRPKGAGSQGKGRISADAGFDAQANQPRSAGLSPPERLPWKPRFICP